MTDTQLAIVPPGYCPRCTITRLSVADGEFCMYCRDDAVILAGRVLPREGARGPQATVWCACGQPVVAGRKMCRICQNERNCENRRRRTGSVRIGAGRPRNS